MRASNSGFSDRICTHPLLKGSLCQESSILPREELMDLEVYPRQEFPNTLKNITPVFIVNFVKFLTIDILLFRKVQPNIPHRTQNRLLFPRH
jgi:hypothetical protein